MFLKYNLKSVLILVLLIFLISLCLKCAIKEKFNKSGFFELNGKKIIILDNISFADLKLIIKKTDLLIACHGSPAHIASSFNTKIIDIFDKKNEEFYKFYTYHLRNYKYLYREDFTILAKNILQLV